MRGRYQVTQDYDETEGIEMYDLTAVGNSAYVFCVIHQCSDAMPSGYM
jgi:hypothetical protein